MQDKGRPNMRYRFLRFPEGKSKVLTLSYDDGTIADKRLVEIINRYGLKCTFNINSDHISRKNRLSEEEIKELLIGTGHEIANHGNCHVALGAVSVKDGLNDVLEGRRELEKRFSQIIKGLAYADTNRKTVTMYEEIVTYLQMLGIAYGRTGGRPNNEFRLPTDWYDWVPTCHHNHPQLFQWLDEFKELDVDKQYWFDKVPRIFYLWGHSSEYNKDDNWQLFEEFCKRASEMQDVWFATNIEIYEYVHAYEQLEFSFNNELVYNPTLYEIWFVYDDKNYVVRPGELMKLN